MITEVNTKELKDALTATTKAKSFDHNSPWQRWVKIKATPDKLSLSVDGGETKIACVISGEIGEIGEIAVDATQLKQIVGNVDSETVILGSDSGMLVVWSGNASIALPLQNMDDYPLTSENTTETPAAAVINAKALKSALVRLAKVAGKGSTQYPYHESLRGVVVDLGQNLTLAASDGYQLAIENLQVDHNIGEIVTVIPAKAWKKAASSISAKAKCTLYATKHALSMVADSLTISIKAIQDTAIDYKSVIPPEDSPYKIHVGAKVLTQALQRAKITASDGAVTLSVRDGKIEVASDCMLDPYYNDGQRVEQYMAYHESIAMLNGFSGSLAYTIKADYALNFCKKQKGVLEIILSAWNTPSLWRNISNPNESAVIMPVNTGGGEPWATEAITQAYNQNTINQCMPVAA